MLSLLDSPSFPCAHVVSHMLPCSRRQLYDLITLAGHTWLNDVVINLYIQLICDRADADTGLPRIGCLSSHFLTKFRRQGHGGVRRWTRKFKETVFSLDKLLVPVNVSESHWACGCINFRDKHIEYVPRANWALFYATTSACACDVAVLPA